MSARNPMTKIYSVIIINKIRRDFRRTFPLSNDHPKIQLFKLKSFFTTVDQFVSYKLQYEIIDYDY
jgi:hypothetical protein